MLPEDSKVFMFRNTEAAIDAQAAADGMLWEWKRDKT